jgi:3-oxoacyl-[acyl-carrier-protein] synthase II
MNLVITGVGVVLPGEVGLGGLLDPRPPAPEPVDPAARLGARGLRYKDRATQLGLCAARDALGDAGLLDREHRPTVPGDSVAVVVSSNLGNVDTVCHVAAAIAENGSRWVSPMDTPNASSNILASQVAIHSGLRGPNVMLCNGATSGLDALRWAGTILRAGRADHVLVLGVEPDNEVARRLMETDRVLDGAVGLVVERADHARDRGATVHAGLGRHTRAGGLSACAERLVDGAASMWFTGEHPAIVPDRLAGVPARDLAASWGTCSGALGVLQCAAAISWFRRGGTGPVLAVCGGDSDDAAAGLVLFPEEAAA